MLEGEDCADPDVMREWSISRVCEEFHCLPSQAIRELEHDPEQLAVSIMRLRAFQRAKQLYDAADTPEARKRLPDSPLIELVQEIESRLAHEELGIPFPEPES